MKDLPFESEIIGVAAQDGEKSFHFDPKNVKKQAEKMKKLVTGIEYSPKIKNLLAGMLEYESEKRISAEEIIEAVG